MKRLSILLLAGLLAGCASDPRNISVGMSESEVASQFGKPVASGRLPGGAQYWDYSLQPFGYAISRVTFTPEGRVREVRNLLTEENFRNLRVGMTPQEVAAIVGPTPASERRVYGGGTKSWSYRYRDTGVVKLLHVIFGEDDRVLHWYTEWDPRVYSKDGGGRDSRGK